MVTELWGLQGARGLSLGDEKESSPEQGVGDQLRALNERPGDVKRKRSRFWF